MNDAHTHTAHIERNSRGYSLGFSSQLRATQRRATQRRENLGNRSSRPVNTPRGRKPVETGGRWMVPLPASVRFPLRRLCAARVRKVEAPAESLHLNV